MPFSLEDSWISCDGAASCPCPNHLGPNWSMPLAFPDDIDSQPSLRHVASGNECPTGDDEEVINRSIPVLQSQIRQTEDALQKLLQLEEALYLELDKVAGEIARLHKHEGTLERALDRRSKIMAPIRRLPSEILTNIFDITLSLSSPSWSTSLQKPVDDAELDDLALVCRRWKHVVLRSPTLWSQICIDPQVSYWRTRTSVGARSLIRHIHLSAQAELDLKFDGGHRAIELLPPLLMTLLGQISSRISSLSLDVSSSRMRSLHPLRDSFDSLRYLAVGRYSSYSESLSIEVFEKAPKLVVFDTAAAVYGGRIGIPWCQIIRHSACGNIHTALESLEAAKNLEAGTFSMTVGSRDPLRVRLDPIVCTRLTYLKVQNVPKNHVQDVAHPLRQLFKQCSFPALDQLYVSTCGGDVPREQPDTIATFNALLRCIQRSQSPLSVLLYDNGPVAPADVDTFFRTTPTISRVEFTRTSSGLSDAAFQSLHVQPGQVDICAPRLESLLLEGELELDAASFAAAVKSRRDVAPLSSIDLHWHKVGIFGPYDEEKTRRRSSGGAVLADELEGVMHLGICTGGCVLPSRGADFM